MGAKRKEVDVLAVLGAAAAGTRSKRGKNAAPTCDGLDARAEVDAYLSAARAAKDAESERKLALAALLPLADQGRAVLASEAGGLAPGSLRLLGTGGAAATVTWPNRYASAAAGTQALDDARELAGARAGAWFVERRSLALKTRAAGDDAVIGELVRALGERRFVELFDVTLSVEPTEAYHRERYALPPADQARLDAAFRPCSPIVRAGSGE